MSNDNLTPIPQHYTSPMITVKWGTLIISHASTHQPTGWKGVFFRWKFSHDFDTSDYYLSNIDAEQLPGISGTTEKRQYFRRADMFISRSYNLPV